LILKKINYWKRIFQAYVLKKTSQLSFWHEDPKVNRKFEKDSINQYYMTFHKKANYNDFLDKDGIPLLDYKGSIGLQYNPIAIAQWGLGNYNLWLDNRSMNNYDKFLRSADWLVNNLEKNDSGLKVWMHHFDFEYRDTLLSPWYSGLAQGQGISLLIRALKETNKDKYKIAIDEALEVFLKETHQGGVNYTDSKNAKWIEEYIVSPPTHILNGFIWALWGIYDYAIFFKDENIKKLFHEYSSTILDNLKSYDLGYWSIYEHCGKYLPMIASLFYHKLHITQLKIMFLITNESDYDFYFNKWNNYLKNRFYIFISFLHKAFFKVLYY